MSKKKPATPVPVTSVVTITTDGGCTIARRLWHVSGKAAEQETATSACRPGDTYSEYEGARIALARLYRVDPFPAEKNAVKEGAGHWEKATKENCKVGTRIRVCAPNFSGGRYHTGDLGVVADVEEDALGPGFTHVLFDGRTDPTRPGCFFHELEAWVPDAQENKPKENKPRGDGRWEKATKKNCKEGSRVRVARAVNSFGKYKDGDTGVVDSWYVTDMAYVKFDGHTDPTRPACYLDELDVWIPDDQAQPQPEAPKPFVPRFRAGDVVRLAKDASIFHPACRGKVGKVIEAHPFVTRDVCVYRLRVTLEHGEVRIQQCTEYPDTPTPLELVFRDPEKGGEKA